MVELTAIEKLNAILVKTSDTPLSVRLYTQRFLGKVAYAIELVDFTRNYHIEYESYGESLSDVINPLYEWYFELEDLEDDDLDDYEDK
jgi:hypothetical protein